MNTTTILIHYGEIALKGKNRPLFERALKENIQNAVSSRLPDIRVSIKSEWGRIVATLSPPLSHEDTETVRTSLAHTFGITSFAFAQTIDSDIEAITRAVENKARTETFASFRITTQRGNKSFPLTSQEINTHVGSAVALQSGARVDLTSPEKTFFIEIGDTHTFIFDTVHTGLRGLPVGSSSKAAVLLSGGIDSPVAALLGMKRGLEVFGVHFHAIPYTSQQSIEKIRALSRVLATYHAPFQVFFVPLAPIQRAIADTAPEKLRVILYRRFMLRITETIAAQQGASGIITGEALGQVASQTLANIAATEDAATLPVLRPLIGFDKEEIMDRARMFGTYDISIEPHEDCCTLFVPTHPETKARLGDVHAAESKLDIDALISQALAGTTSETIHMAQENRAESAPLI